MPPTGESTERVIIFTEYRDTQRWLCERLLAAGYPARRPALLYGGQDEQDREHVKNVFTADPELDEVRVLIATDAASEGINLQWHRHRVLQLIEAATTQPNVTVLVIPRHTPRPGRGPRASRVAQEQSQLRQRQLRRDQLRPTRLRPDPGQQGPRDRADDCRDPPLVGHAC